MNGVRALENVGDFTKFMRCINFIYLFKDFMRHGTYYKVTLFKWQDKENVMREPGSTAATLTDELTENFDDLFKAEDEKEFTQIKPTVLRNRRYYTSKQVEIIKLIKFLLKDKGMTINGVKKI